MENVNCRFILEQMTFPSLKGRGTHAGTVIHKVVWNAQEETLISRVLPLKLPPYRLSSYDHNIDRKHSDLIM